MTLKSRGSRHHGNISLSYTNKLGTLLLGEPGQEILKLPLDFSSCIWQAAARKPSLLLLAALLTSGWQSPKENANSQAV